MPLTTTAISTKQLPSLDERQEQWEHNYRRYGDRANMPTRLRDVIDDITHQEYEKYRVSIGRALVIINMREIDSYYDRFPSDNQIINAHPKLIVDLCPGLALLEGAPGNLAVEARNYGYRLLAVEFAKFVLPLWRQRVRQALCNGGFECSEPRDIRIVHGRMHEYLCRMNDESTDIATSLQAWQHTPPEELKEICTHLKRVVKPWGRVIAELPCEDDNDPTIFSDRTILYPWSYIEAEMRPLSVLEKHVVPIYDGKERSTFAVFGNPQYSSINRR